MPDLTLRRIDGSYAVARLQATAPEPSWLAGNLVSVTRTPEELSVICADGAVPSGIDATRDLALLRVVGVLEHDETGILAALTAPLATAGIPVFALATYDTDYVLVPGDRLAAAVAAWADAGIETRDDGDVPGASGEAR